MNILRQMYKEAKPSADIDKLMKQGVTTKINWYMDYYLPIDRQRDILEMHCKRNKLEAFERKALQTEIFLGAAPNSSKQSTNIKGWT